MYVVYAFSNQPTSFCLSPAALCQLTHWGLVTHICVNKVPIIGSDNGLSRGRRQAIIWTSSGILLIGPLETNFSEILIETHASKNIVCKMACDVIYLTQSELVLVSPMPRARPANSYGIKGLCDLIVTLSWES